MDNYQYATEWVVEANSKGAVVLDFGCGTGKIVQKINSSGIEAFGCDVFYGGGDRSSQVIESVRNRVVRMHENRIPFEDQTFDLVINNLVMEHVPDLAFALREIDRVLKPGGKVLSLFPDRYVWREGHCGIPFLHWFSKQSTLRIYYAYLLRTLGAGYHKENKNKLAWCRDWIDYLDKWTYYRSISEIKYEYHKYFSLKFIESNWFDKRAPYMRFLPSGLKALVVRKLGMLVFEATKNHSELPLTKRADSALSIQC